MKERTPLLKAYDRVILRVKAMYAEEHGKTAGALNWFAGQIGISRQTLDNWASRSGIPPPYVGKIAKITGLKKDEIRPPTFHVIVTQDAWKAYASKELVAESTIYLEGRRQHGKAN